MRAILIREFGGPEVLRIAEEPEAELSPNSVKIAVRYAGVNRADILQRAGFYPAPPGVHPMIPGLEYAGTVVAIGSAVTRFAPGDRVCGLVGGGAYAEEVVAHECEVARVPSGVSDEAAGAVPEVFVTAYDALVVRGGLSPGDTVLIHAAGSGVGTAAIQIAKLFGAFVIATSRTEDKLQRCKELGADAAFCVHNAAFEKQVLEVTSGRGADITLELAGGAYVAEDVRAAAQLGRIVIVGLTAGARTEVDLRLVLSKRLSLVGTVLRSRPLAEKFQAAQMLEKNILPLVEKGRLVPVVDKTFAFADAAAAHEYVASNASFGKVLLDVARSL
ncbi:MAG: NAD(P)H-quinone oxidoreductase [Polyangiaceae bacterium]|nr:NAD(P)H-quinone oxidoreductase [Polyangiaceae bacterium]